jgi:hypothetical protein
LPDLVVEEIAALAGPDLEKRHRNRALRKAAEATRRGRRDDDDEQALVEDTPCAPPDLDRSSLTTRVAGTRARSTLQAITSLTTVKVSLTKAVTEAIATEVTMPPEMTQTPVQTTTTHSSLTPERGAIEMGRSARGP